MTVAADGRAGPTAPVITFGRDPGHHLWGRLDPAVAHLGPVLLG